MRKVSSQESILTDLSADLEATSLHSSASTGSPGRTIALVVAPPATSSAQNSPTLTHSIQSLSDSSPTGQAPNPSEISKEKPKKRRTRSFLRRIESLRRKDKEKPDSAKAREEEGAEAKAWWDSSKGVADAPPGQVSSSVHSDENRLSTGYRTKPVVRSKQPKRCGVYLEDYETAVNKGSSWDAGGLGYQDTFRRDYLVHLPGDHKPGTFPKSLSIESLCPLESGGCFSNWKCSNKASGLSAGGVGNSSSTADPSLQTFTYRQRRLSCSSTGSRASLYDNVPELTGSSDDLFDLDREVIYENLDDVLEHVWGLQQKVELWSKAVRLNLEGDSVGEGETDSGGEPAHLTFEERSVSDIGTSTSDFESTANSLNDVEDIEMRERRDSGVGASLTRPCR